MKEAWLMDDSFPPHIVYVRTTYVRFRWLSSGF